MDRREFSKVMGGVVAGMVAGAKGLSFAEEKKAEAKKVDTHICKGHNDCKGKGGCKTDANACAGKNECKGKGGCAATAAKHECAGKNECKGQGGCGATAGKNECKGKGGCAVPVKAEHAEKKEKSACSGKSGCKSL